MPHNQVTTDENILIYKFTASTGDHRDLPILDVGEFALTNDTGQVFIGASMDDSIYINPKAVKIYPINNARQVVQGYLSEDPRFSFYVVNDDLTINTGSPADAATLAQYINDKNRDNIDGQTKRPIAAFKANIEIITDNNIHDYIHPGDLVITKSYSEQHGTLSKALMNKQLDTSSMGVFLEYALGDFLSLDVEYFLTQHDADDTIVHSRKGNLSVVVKMTGDQFDKTGFTDSQTMIDQPDHDTDIKFDVESYDGKVRVKFNQPSDHTTSIEYRVSRWNISN